MKNLIDYRFVLGIIFIFAFLILTKHETPEKHLHQVVECRYAHGMKTYNLVFCHTEKAQVGFNEIHRNNINAERFFSGELVNCEAPYERN